MRWFKMLHLYSQRLINHYLLKMTVELVICRVSNIKCSDIQWVEMQILGK